jgi:3-dehydroquinate dehydratase type I
MRNPVAVSLALPDTGACLEALREAAPRVGMAEVRLDSMGSIDLDRLIGQSPLPLILTCRPPREGGRFAGSEAERLQLLARAAELGVAYLDVEWDAVSALRSRLKSPTRLIVSRHWQGDVRGTLVPEYERLRTEGDVVKLAVAAQQPLDMLPVFELLERGSGPLIAMAMGDCGRLTRILAPCFESCLLTYGALDAVVATAPGQLTVAEMAEDYGLSRVGAWTRIHLRFCADAASAQAVLVANRRAAGRDLNVPLVGTPPGLPELAALLERRLPRLDVTADASLGLPFAEAGIEVPR